MVELWIVRHGQTDWNCVRRIQGWTEVALNATGRKQAHLLACHLEGIPFQAIISSDLGRAVETSQILQQHVPAPMCIDERLRERSYGRCEGLLQSEADATYPEGCPDAESRNHLGQRALAVFTELTGQHRHGRIVCVTHGGVIRTLLNMLGCESVPPIDNTGVTRISLYDNQWHITDVNGTAHLHNVSDANPARQKQAPAAIRHSSQLYTRKISTSISHTTTAKL